MAKPPRHPLCVLLLTLGVFAGCSREPSPVASEHSIIPNPSEFRPAADNSFMIDSGTGILVDAADSRALAAAEFLAGIVGNTVDTTPRISSEDTFVSTIELTTQSADPALGPEGYELTVVHDRIVVGANSGAGLFYGVQTIRQLLPPLVEYSAAYVNPLPVPAVVVRDSPRFSWRGLMLDVSRHFLPADDVKRFIDLMAMYKMNRLHLHLSNDQGWRIEIPSRPRLTEIGGRGQVGGKGGGFYTTEEFRGIVRYAADRYVTIVPEIDIPGHTNAALASYAELNCDGQAREPYTGVEVGFSSVCIDKPETWRFLEDVIRDIAAVSPGPWFHIGGDEVRTIPEAQYIRFIEGVRDIVQKYGKRLVGWDEILAAELEPGSIAQLWRPIWEDPPAEDGSETSASAKARQDSMKEPVYRAIEGKVQFILSPANRIYLDMKYDDGTILGLKWAGLSDVRNAYDWSIGDVFGRIPEASVAGVEAALWSESLGSIHDFEYLAFPRLPGVAELGWSKADRRNWDEYKNRLAAHGERWTALGVNYHRTGLVPWPNR